MSVLAVRDLARVGLVADEPPLALPDGAAWDVLWEDVRAERAVPLLASGIRTGAVEAGAGPRATVVRAHEAAMHACVTLERVALDVVDRLAAADVPARLLKGPAVAHLDYPDPSWRGFGDVDLLVRSEDYDAAVATLVAAGGSRRSDEVRPGFDRRFGKGVCLIRADGVQVDLHRTLASGPFGLTVDTDELFASVTDLDLGGRRVTVLDQDLRFVHACFHAALGDFPPRLTALRDVAQMVVHGRVDLDRARAVAAGWRAGVVLATAVATAWTVLRLPRRPAVEWAFRYVPSRYERSALAAYVGPHRSYARQMIAAVPAVPGLRERVRYVSSLVFADRDYLARRDRSYLRRVGRGLRTRVPGAST